MNKKFTINVPDELYTNTFILDKELTLTYSGSATMRVEVNGDGSVDGVIPFEDYQVRPPSAIIDVYANTTPEVAYLLGPAPEPEFTFEEQILDDDTVWLNNTNPRLHDYYTLRYETENETWKLVPLTKDPHTPGYKVADGRKRYLEIGVLIHGQVDEGSNTDIKQFLSDRYNIGADLNADDIVNTIQQYVEELDTYMLAEGTKMAWKYENFTTAPVPPTPLDTIFGN